MIAKALLYSCAFSTLLSIALTASAQADDESTSKFFVKLIGGYSFIGPASFTGVNRTERTAGPSSILNEFATNKKKFGIGPKIGAGIGFIVNDKINMGLDVMYIKGIPLVITNYINKQNDTSGATIKTTTTHIDVRYEYSLLNFVPHITFKAISTDKYYIYNRVGLIIALPLDLTFSYKGTNSVQTQTRSNTGVITANKIEDNSYDHYGNFSKNPTLGYQAALGVQFIVSDNLRFFVEVEASSIVLIPKEFLYEKWSVNTVTMTTLPAPASKITSTDSAIRHMHFQKKGQERTVVNPTTKTIDVYTTQTKMATNSLGVNIGLALRL